MGVRGALFVVTLGLCALASLAVPTDVSVRNNPVDSIITYQMLGNGTDSTDVSVRNNPVDYIITYQMSGNNDPDGGKVIAPDTPSGKKNVGYKAFDRKFSNKVPMYCAADADCEQPLQLVYHFTQMFTRSKKYKLFVASDIPEEQKPVNWILECQDGTQDPWHELDTVEGFDWSSTEVYMKVLDSEYEMPFCNKYRLTITNPLDAEGGMAATISELAIYGADG